MIFMTIHFKIKFKLKNLLICFVAQQEAWANRLLQQGIDWEGVQIDPAPFQLVERTSLHKVHSLFSLLGLNHAYVTNTGRLVGVVGLKEVGGGDGVGVRGGAHVPTQGPLAVLTARAEPRLRHQHRETGGRRRTERGGWRGVGGGTVVVRGGA